MKLYVNSLLAVLCFLCSAVSLWGQVSQPNPPQDHPYHCLDDATLLNERPQEIVDKIAGVRNRAIQRNVSGFHESFKQNCHAVYRIPVVFHVIHNRGVDSIAASQIQTQMTVLNEDYRKRTGTPGDGTGVDTQIEFYLATRDPGGNFTTGITYTDTSLANFTYTLSNDSALKAVIKWPQQQYLNIWVVDTIQYMASYLLGYASLPSDGFDILDGIVVADQYVGRDTGTAKNGPYNKGRTLTHEAGHYLGLLHPFDYVTSPCEGDSAANCATAGDFVCDVPPHANPHYSCSGPPVNSCTEHPNDTADFVNNYMEYVNDTCMDMFSQGQANYMHANIDADSFRTIMTSTQNLIATGIHYHGFPDAYFIAVPPGGCTGETVQFIDQSLGLGPMPGFPNPDAMWFWSFPGGTPDTSNAQNPMVRYDSPGNYVATLQVANSFGVCNWLVPITVTGPNLSAVSDTVSMGNATSFTSFADEPGTWSWNFGDGTGDSASTQANPMYVYPVFGEYIYTATFTPEDTNQCVAFFTDTAFFMEFPLPMDLLSWNGRALDEQQVGLQWTLAAHATAAYFEVEASMDGQYFLPIGVVRGQEESPSKTIYTFLDQDPVQGVNHYRLRMVDSDGEVSWTEILQVEVQRDWAVELFPNPTAGDFQLRAKGILEMQAEIHLYDLMGKNILSENHIFRKGENLFNLSLSSMGRGMFFIEIRDLERGTIQFQGRISKLP